MTNAEKFKEVFGMRHDSYVSRKGKRDTKLVNTQTFWESEFKKPKEADKDFTGCDRCVHSEDSEEVCKARLCVHAIHELKDCYKERKQESE